MNSTPRHKEFKRILFSRTRDHRSKDRRRRVMEARRFLLSSVMDTESEMKQFNNDLNSILPHLIPTYWKAWSPLLIQRLIENDENEWRDQSFLKSVNRSSVQFRKLSMSSEHLETLSQKVVSLAWWSWRRNAFLRSVLNALDCINQDNFADFIIVDFKAMGKDVIQNIKDDLLALCIMNCPQCDLSIENCHCPMLHPKQCSPKRCKMPKKALVWLQAKCFQESSQIQIITQSQFIQVLKNHLPELKYYEFFRQVKESVSSLPEEEHPLTIPDGLFEDNGSDASQAPMERKYAEVHTRRNNSQRKMTVEKLRDWFSTTQGDLKKEGPGNFLNNPVNHATFKLFPAYETKATRRIKQLIGMKVNPSLIQQYCNRFQEEKNVVQIQRYLDHLSQWRNQYLPSYLMYILHAPLGLISYFDQEFCIGIMKNMMENAAHDPKSPPIPLPTSSSTSSRTSPIEEKPESNYPNAFHVCFSREELKHIENEDALVMYLEWQKRRFDIEIQWLRLVSKIDEEFVSHLIQSELNPVDVCERIVSVLKKVYLDSLDKEDICPRCQDTIIECDCPGLDATDLKYKPKLFTKVLDEFELSEALYEAFPQHEIGPLVTKLCCH
jgi:hypothetical protein